MYEYDGYKYFLLVTDIFSSKIWCEALKHKDEQTVREAFDKIFDSLGDSLPSQISTDQGKEFSSQKKYFESKHILLTYKYGKNKANFSEFGVYLVKKRLWMLMRSKLTSNWPKYLQAIVDALNQRPLKRIGYLKPADINSDLDDIKVQQALSDHKIEPYRQPDWRTQEKNQTDYENSTKNVLQVGTYVYADQKQQVFNKSFYIQVSCSTTTQKNCFG
jgi:hypothetical protein